MYEQKIIENLREYSAEYQYEDQKLSETCFRAANAIEKLLGVIQRQKEMINATAYLPLYPKPMKWISVTERLPKENSEVLIVTERRDVIYGTFADGLFSDDWQYYTPDYVVWWMYIPKPPKEETDG